MACLLAIFLREDKMILNMPVIISFVLLFIPFLILFCYSYSKDNKSEEFIIIGNLFNSSIMSFFIFIVLKMGVNFYVKKYSETQDMTTTTIPISNFISGRLDLIYFNFKEEEYSLRYTNSKHLKRNEIINNYNLKLEYSKSIFGTYVIKNYYIVDKSLKK